MEAKVEEEENTYLSNAALQDNIKLAAELIEFIDKTKVTVEVLKIDVELLEAQVEELKIKRDTFIDERNDSEKKNEALTKQLKQHQDT